MLQKQVREKKLLRRLVVEKRAGISRSGIYDRLDPKSRRFDPTFPKPVKLGKHAIGFVEEEVDAWIESLIAKRDEQINRGGVQ